MPTYRTLQGFADILPDEQPYWRYLEGIIEEVTQLYGYRRIDTPILEDEAVFHKAVGEGTDIVEHEMYVFTDRTDKEGKAQRIALRPEGTAAVVRAYLQHGMSRLPQPVKLYYLQMPMFRRERPQAGRYREHHQFGCEVIGENDPAVDAEVISLLYEVYTRLNLEKVHVYLNSSGDKNCRPHYIEVLKAYYKPLLADCCQDCQSRYEKNPLRLLDCKQPQDQEKIANAPRITEYLCGPCREHFEGVKTFLDQHNVPYTLDPLMVRGIDYYGRTVFEFKAGKEGLALNGGGRYDGLAEILGGPSTPGIGFGAGMERIILELKKQGIVPPAEPKPVAFVTYIERTPELKAAAVKIVGELRHAGLKAEMSYGDRSAKAQMKQANASGAPYAIILGPDELANNQVTVRMLLADKLSTEEKQTQIPRSELLTYLRMQG